MKPSRAAVLELRRAITKSAAKRHRPKAYTPDVPVTLVRDYTRTLVDLSRTMDAAIFAALRRRGWYRTDADVIDAPRGDVSEVMREIVRRLEEITGRDSLVKDVEAIAARVGNYSAIQWRKELRARIGIVPDLPDIPNMDVLARQFRNRNLSLIRALSQDKVQRVRRVMLENNGARVEEVSQRIRETTGASESHAALIARDQTLKFNGQVMQERQQAAGVTEYTWSTSKDERVRPDHAILDGRKFSYAEPPIVDQKTGRREPPGQDFQCLPGETPIRETSAVLSVFRRSYRGQLTSLVTDTGEAMDATPNHPILTQRGWLPAHLVNVGDHVFSTQNERPDVAKKDVEHGQLTIAKVFNAFALMYPMERVGGLASQFHGDGFADEDVNVVRADWSLPNGVEPSRAKQAQEILLSLSDSHVTGSQASGQCDPFLVFRGVGGPADRIVCGLRNALALRGGGAFHALEHGRAPTPLQSVLSQGIGNRLPRYAEGTREGQNARASLEFLAQFSDVELFRIVRWSVRSFVHVPDSAETLAQKVAIAAQESGALREGHASVKRTLRVVQKFSREFSSHVYNLETVAGWYDATIITHNCRCTAIAVIPGFDDV